MVEWGNDDDYTNNNKQRLVEISLEAIFAKDCVRVCKKNYLFGLSGVIKR